MDLLGIPVQLIVCPRCIEEGYVEIKDRKTGITEKINSENVITKIMDDK